MTKKQLNHSTNLKVFKFNLDKKVRNFILANKSMPFSFSKAPPKKNSSLILPAPPPLS